MIKKWSVRALILWTLGMLATLGVMLGAAIGFGLIAFYEKRWFFGMPFVFAALLAMYRVPMTLKILWEVLCEFPGAVRERRW